VGATRQEKEGPKVAEFARSIVKKRLCRDLTMATTRIRSVVGFAVVTGCGLMSGCGGGGGDGIAKECVTYCEIACGKLGVCEGFSQDLIDRCANSCEQKYEDDGNDDPGSCQRASAFIVSANCAQIEQIVGLRSLVIRSGDGDSNKADDLGRALCTGIADRD
jgi:hypothetical protein